MNITIDGLIYQRQQFGGISRIFSEILPRMCVVDDDVFFLLLVEGAKRGLLPKHPNITTKRTPIIERYVRTEFLRKLAVNSIRNFVWQNIHRFTGVDIWHTTYYRLSPSWSGPYVVTVYDMIHERFAASFPSKNLADFRIQKERCVDQADAIICISDTTRKDLISYYGILDHVHVIKLGCGESFRVLDNEEDQVDLPAIGNRPFIVYVGDRNGYKDFKTLLESYANWNGRGDIALITVGTRWSANERAMLEKYQLESDIQLLQGVSDEDLSRIYNRAQAFVCTSQYEGFGLTLVEAMACGCPVVATDIPSTREVAGDVPIYFEVGDSESLVEAIDRAIEEGRRSSRVALGLERAEQYSWDRVAQKTLELYRSLI